MSFKDIKVLTIGAVGELTNLTERQIRYYEERGLIFPERSKGGTRKYSFTDVEKLVEISKKVDKGITTHKIKIEEKKKQQESQLAKEQQAMKKMLQGQINATFNRNIHR